MLREKVESACFQEIEAMKKAGEKEQMTLLALHAAILRQLIDQAGDATLGAHSLSGLEATTKYPDFMIEFLRHKRDFPLLCELALRGLCAFDQSIQRHWLCFLAENRNSQKLELLNKDLQEIEALGRETLWFFTHFSSEPLPKIDEVLAQNQSPKKIYPTLFALQALSNSAKNITSVPNLENFWNDLAQETTAFLQFCKEEKRQDPSIVDLINLWDESVKIVKTSHLFTKKEEESQFKKRVQAFKAFALEASTSHALSYSLEELLERGVESWGNQNHNFSVQHWLIPVSRGALSTVETDDQLLTVIHQNLLQATSYKSLDNLPIKLPKQLQEAYEIFKKQARCSAKRFGEDRGLFISFGREQVSIKVNIPLNYHSNVVTFHQKKGEEQIEVTAYYRGSDNDRGMHLNFFKVFSSLTRIALIDSEHTKPDLKVVFTVKNQEEAQLLSKAIHEINAAFSGSGDDLSRLARIIGGKKEKEAMFQKIIAYLWEELKRSGTLIHISTGGVLQNQLWGFLKEKNLLPELVDRAVLELEGKLPFTDFGAEFQRKLFKYLPPEQCKAMIWQSLLGNQKVSLHLIPSEVSNELLKKLCEENPIKASQLIRYGMISHELIEFMSLKLRTTELKSFEEDHSSLSNDDRIDI